MKEIGNKLKSIKVKLFGALCIVVIAIVLLLILLNNFVLSYFYKYSKVASLTNVYNEINKFYEESNNSDISAELDKIAINNNFDILIRNNDNISIYTSNKDFFYSIIGIYGQDNRQSRNENIILKQNDKYVISEFRDIKTTIRYIMLTATLSNDYNVFIRMPITSIEESVEISNRFLYTIAIFIMLIGGIIVSVVSSRFSKPIVELNEIAKKMAKLDFSQKYKESSSNDEIDTLGKSINKMSEKLESTIEQLRNTNIELERDIEEKSKIDEMRKSFISDVSHELKTPIALIEGYSEGLIENVNTDEESRKFYAEVILDEATKMDILVKRLLELMKLEYGSMEFNNKKFNLSELEREILRKSKVMIEKENIILETEISDNIEVFADDFYIDQVLTNYITNAIKYAEEINGVKKIKIKNEINREKNIVRVKVFNTYSEFSEEDKVRIWKRFYKADESRNREKGGNGIGLSIVKAIMKNYGNEYGVKNVLGGVEFYFDININEIWVFTLRLRYFRRLIYFIR